MMAGEKSHGRVRTRKWTKTWDPNKQSNKDKCENKSTVKEKGSEEETEFAQHACCGGQPCKAAQRRTDEFGKELSALTQADADRKIQIRNLASKYKLPLSLVDNLHDVFCKFDHDNDGTVSGKEILDVFRTVGAIFTRQQCDDVIKSFLGGNIAGEIDFEEMIKMFARRKSNPKDYQQDLGLAFKMFDLDGDGYVCAEDLKQVMKALGNDLTDAQIRTIYSHLDTDDNGLIDFEEFESILYPETRQQPLMKKKRTKSPHTSKHKLPKASTGKKEKPKPAVLGLGAIPGVMPSSSGIYNSFYSERGSAHNISVGRRPSRQDNSNKPRRTRFASKNNSFMGQI